MKKVLKVLGILVLIIVLGVVGIASYVKIGLPNVGPASDIKVNSTPELVQRGEYLANHVFVCIDCHSTRDWSKLSAPIIAGTQGKGGEQFDQTMGFPGKYFARNITPAGIGNWTDGEIFRTITTGVDRNGKAIFPVMPYHAYGKMDAEDVKAVIAYLRTLPAIENKPPTSESDFPMNFLINTMPSKAELTTKPSPSDSVAYGKYLFTGAACHECHTPFDKGKFTEELAFAGGRSFPMPSGTITSANITPDKETGIGNWTREQFIKKFKFYADSANQNIVLKPTDMQTIMPWTMFGGMTESDLSSIYSYIQTLAPIKHSVIKFKPKG
jgi:mono/diheme cytochrome c family protein